MREETTNLFWSPVGINNWQPLGDVISTPHFSNEQIEQDHWADKGMFTVTATVKTTNKIRRLFHVKKRRLPRKMKKAVKKHCIYERAFDYYVCRIDGGHFNTKWLLKAAYHMALKYQKETGNEKHKKEF